MGEMGGKCQDKMGLETALPGCRSLGSGSERAGWQKRGRALKPEMEGLGHAQMAKVLESQQMLVQKRNAQVLLCHEKRKPNLFSTYGKKSPNNGPTLIAPYSPLLP